MVSFPISSHIANYYNNGFLPQLFSIGLLFYSAVTTVNIHKLESRKYYNETDISFDENVLVPRYKTGAMVFVILSSTIIVLHVIMVTVRVLYLCSVIKDKFNLYALVVSECMQLYLCNIYK